MNIAHCDAVGYVHIMRCDHEQRRISLKDTTGRGYKKEYAAAIRSELLLATQDSEEIQ